MHRYWSVFLSLFVLCSAAALAFYTGCGDDDDNDASDDSDDDGADDTGVDDDTAPTWDERCENFVQEFTEACEHDLFSYDPDQSTEACKIQSSGIPWECVVACWEEYQNCFAWFDCIDVECGVEGPTDDTADDTGDDTSADDDTV